MIKGNATPQQIEAILDRLASDDAFREQMLGDPVAALKGYGLEVDPAQVPAVRKLPSKQELVKTRDHVKEQVEGHLGLIMFLLK